MSEKPLQPVDDVRQFVGKDPSGLPQFLSSLTPGGVYFRGTTIRAIQPEFIRLPNSLIVPVSYARPVQPIDQVTTFLGFNEIFDISVPIGAAYEELTRVAIVDAVVLAAGLLNIIRRPGISRATYDPYFANLWFVEPVRTRVKNLVRNSNRALVVPQAVLKVVQQAMLISPPSISPETSEGSFIVSLLILTDHLGRDAVEENSESILKDVPGELGRELIANQMFNSEVHEPHSLGRFIRTWLQLPTELKDDPQVVNLEEEFFRHSGVRLRDLIAVGVALWSTAMRQGPVINMAHYESSALSVERLNAALSLISAPIPKMRDLVKEELGDGNLDWAFDPFNRFPVIRLSESELVVLDPDLLMRRVFGWIVWFDIKYGSADRVSSEQERAQRIKAVEQCLQHLAEVYTGEVLDSIAPDLPTQRRVYHDAELKRAFSATGVQIADVAIDYGDAWVVVEVTTTHMRRESVKGESDEAVMADLEKFVGEARQIDSTIARLRQREQDLTGYSGPTSQKKYYPLIVATEGFPTSPITMTLLRDRLRDENLLSHGDTMPLEIVDIAELEMIEGVQAAGGPSLRQILDNKSRAGLALCAMNQYLTVEAKLEFQRAPRVQRLFTESLNAAIEELFPGMPLLPVVDAI